LHAAGDPRRFEAAVAIVTASAITFLALFLA
jgi:hypothetical protein